MTDTTTVYTCVYSDGYVTGKPEDIVYYYFVYAHPEGAQNMLDSLTEYPEDMYGEDVHGVFAISDWPTPQHVDSDGYITTIDLTEDEYRENEFIAP